MPPTLPPSPRPLPHVASSPITRRTLHVAQGLVRHAKKGALGGGALPSQRPNASVAPTIKSGTHSSFAHMHVSVPCFA